MKTTKVVTCLVALLLCAGMLLGADAPVTAALTANITASSRTMPVASTASIRPLSEVLVDSELIKVCSINAALKTVSVCKDGRGRQGTTAASHSSGALVLINPFAKKSADGAAVVFTGLAVLPPGDAGIVAVDANGAMSRSVTAPSANKGACWKSDNTLGHCTSVLDAGGGCTCI